MITNGELIVKQEELGISREIVRMRSSLKSDIECAFWKGRLMAERKLGNKVPQKSALTSLYIT